MYIFFDLEFTLLGIQYKAIVIQVGKEYRHTQIDVCIFLAELFSVEKTGKSCYQE